MHYLLFTSVILGISQQYQSKLFRPDPINFEYDYQQLLALPAYVFSADMSRIRNAIHARSEARKAKELTDQINQNQVISSPPSQYDTKYGGYDQNTYSVKSQSSSYMDNVFAAPSIFDNAPVANDPLEASFSERYNEISKNQYGAKFDTADAPFVDTGKSNFSEDVFLRDLDNWKLAIGMGDSGNQFQRQIRNNNSVTFYSEWMITDLSNTTTNAAEMDSDDLFPEWLDLDLTNMTLVQKEAFRSRGFTDYTVLYEDIFKQKSILDTETIDDDPNTISAPVQAQNETRNLMFNQTIIVRWQSLMDQDGNMISGSLFEVIDHRESYLTEDDRIFRLESEEGKNITASSEDHADQLEDLAEAVQEWITVDLEVASGDIGEETSLMPANSTRLYLPRGLLVDITYDNATVPQLWKGLQTLAPLNVTQQPMMFNSED